MPSSTVNDTIKRMPKPSKIIKKQVDGKTLCATPTLGKQPTRIDTWKYQLIRHAILNVFKHSPEGVLFKQLAGLVAEQLEVEQIQNLGSIGWYTTVVKLHLETIGELYRVDGRTPQFLKLNI